MHPAAQTPQAAKRERGRALRELATRQHGVVARWQLLGLGFGEQAIKIGCALGRLSPVHREVFAVGHRRLTKFSRWSAAVLAYGPDALLSHQSAAALWGLARPPRGPVHVTAGRGRQGVDRRAGVWIHRGRLHPEDRTVEAGIPVTSLARTLFDCAEVVEFERLRQAWEEADRLGLLHLAALERVLARGRGRRALRPTRALLASARWSERRRSPLEDRFHDFCLANHLPLPATNVLVLGHEVDALWPAAQLIAELDSWEFHRHRAAFDRDRARDSARLVAGYRTIRITHRRLDSEARTLLAELRALLAPA